MQKRLATVLPGVLLAGVLTGGFCSLAVAQETGGLKLPEDIEARESAAASDSNVGSQKFQIEERRIGGRLERVTVYRSNGLDEVYENREPDSMWLSEEDEIGDVPNVRRWTIGSW